MSNRFSVETIQDWLNAYIAKVIEGDVEEIDIEASFDTFGLESSSVASMTGDLADWLEEDIDPSIIFEYPTIKDLSEQVFIIISNKSEQKVVV